MGGWPGTWRGPPRREPCTREASLGKGARLGESHALPLLARTKLTLEQVGRRVPALARTKLTLVQQLRQREARLVLQQKVQLPGGCDLRCHASTPDREGRRRLGLDLKIPMRTGNMRLQWRSQ